MVCEMFAELLNCTVALDVAEGCASELMSMIYRFLDSVFCHREKLFLISNRKKKVSGYKKTILCINCHTMRSYSELSTFFSCLFLQNNEYYI